MSKPNILFIDLWMPSPDRDTASLRCVNLLNILEKIAGKLTLAAFDSPEWREDFKIWIPQRDSDIETIQGNSSIEEHLHRCGKRYDIVIISRLITANRCFEIVSKCAPEAKKIFDTTDLKYLRSFRGAKVTGSKNMLRTALSAKNDELSLVKKADCTWVVSKEEKKILENESPRSNIHVVSSIHSVYDNVKPFSERNGILFLGSFTHHPNEDAIFYFFEEIHPLLRKKLPDIKILIIGSHQPDWLKEAATDNDNIELMEYVPELDPYFNRIKLSFVPLRYGAGIKGKALLSMGYGVPVVGSTIAAEGITSESEMEMLIGDSSGEFVDAIVNLYQNEDLWNRLSENGMKVVEQNFSFPAVKKALLDSFESMEIYVRD